MSDEKCKSVGEAVLLGDTGLVAVHGADHSTQIGVRFHPREGLVAVTTEVCRQWLETLEAPK